MAGHNLARDLNYIAGELDLALEYIRALQRRIGEQTTTRPTEPEGTVLENVGGILHGPITSVDDIRAGEPIYVHRGPRHYYASRSPQPSNVLQAPGLMDVPLEVRAPGNRPHGPQSYIQDLGSSLPARGYTDSEGHQVHSATCGRANGQCDCGAQSNLGTESYDADNC
jgi:hypothetical protein